MKYTNVDVYPTCPKCKSNRTGFIKPRTVWSGKKEAKDLYRSIAHGKYVKYVQSKKYEDYYKQYNINMYCEDCGYEFRGELKNMQMDKDCAEDYMESRGCEDTLQAAKLGRMKLATKMKMLFSTKGAIYEPESVRRCTK